MACIAQLWHSVMPEMPEGQLGSSTAMWWLILYAYVEHLICSICCKLARVPWCTSVPLWCTFLPALVPAVLATQHAWPAHVACIHNLFCVTRTKRARQVAPGNHTCVHPPATHTNTPRLILCDKDKAGRAYSVGYTAYSDTVRASGSSPGSHIEAAFMIAPHPDSRWSLPCGSSDRISCIIMLMSRHR